MWARSHSSCFRVNTLLQVVEEKGLTNLITVEACDCQVGLMYREDTVMFALLCSQCQVSDAWSHYALHSQGECGYGPNVVVNGKIKNNVKGKDGVIQALGM